MSEEQDSIDIIDIDNKIRKKFNDQYKGLPEKKARLEELEKTAKSGKLQPRIVSEVERSIESLREEIEKIEEKTELNFYTLETLEILQRYNDLLKIPKKISFMGVAKVDNKEKKELVKKYVEIAGKYYDIPVKYTEKKFKMSCNGCSNKKDFATEENAYICLYCGAQQEQIESMTSYKDVDRVNITAKYTYDKKVHFRDCVNQYQGKQNCTIEQKVYDDLEKMFESHHLLGDKDEGKTGRFAKITKEHVLMFLKELGYTKHYENVTLIHYNMTGKKPDDISHLEDALFADFDTLVEEYDKCFKNKVERVNFISTQVVLYLLLLKHKHPCKKEDFVILKTVDRKNFHTEVMGKLFSNLGWTYNCVL